uniref:Uncharacterized protein n=1 Tax=Brassica oleracea TaxID=3712 RepID=A0A3P6EB19_BRAOL|nr:unnamed protein product [Brassica oleracea]
MAKELAAKAKEAFVDDDFDVAANVKLEHFIGNFFAT